MANDDELEIIDIYPSTPIKSGDTISFPYPAGRDANNYTLGTGSLLVRGTGTVFNDVSPLYGLGAVTLTYTGATIPPGTRVSLQLPLLVANKAGLDYLLLHALLG